MNQEGKKKKESTFGNPKSIDHLTLPLELFFLTGRGPHDTRTKLKCKNFFTLRRWYHRRLFKPQSDEYLVIFRH